MSTSIYVGLRSSILRYNNLQNSIREGLSMKIDSDEVTSSDRGTLEFTSEESVHPRLEFIRFSVAVRLRKEDLVLKCNTYATGLVSLASVLTLSNKCVAISMYIRFNIIMLNRENGRSWKSFFFFFANFIRIIIVGSCN